MLLVQTSTLNEVLLISNHQMANTTVLFLLFFSLLKVFEIINIGLPPNFKFDNFIVSIIKVFTIFWHQQIVIAIFVFFTFTISFQCTHSSSLRLSSHVHTQKLQEELYFSFLFLQTLLCVWTPVLYTQRCWFQQQFNQEQKYAG